MSSSFLKPSVTPATALATRLRASPWNLPSSGSSRSSVATRAPPSALVSCANTTPGGTTCRILPFGPWTSTAPPAIFTVTPFGIGIGFLPILDIASSVSSAWAKATNSPYVAQDFAADAGLFGGPPRHHAARRRQNRGAEAAQHRWHVVDAEIDAAAGPADALETADHAFPVGAVLQEDADQLARLATLFLRRRLDQPESLDVALVLKDPRNLRLQLAGGQLHTRVLGSHCVADARDHVCDWICHFVSFTTSSWSHP